LREAQQTLDQALRVAWLWVRAGQLAVVGALQLRHSEKLSEKGFLTLMRLALSQAASLRNQEAGLPASAALTFASTERLHPTLPA
jgi:hypothetical protein